MECFPRNMSTMPANIDCKRRLQNSAPPIGVLSIADVNESKIMGRLVRKAKEGGYPSQDH